MATTAHQFNNITLGGRVSSTKGVLKVNSTVFLWRTEAGRVINVQHEDLSGAFWTRINGRVFQLKLQLNIGNSIKFDGFRESDYDVLKTFLAEHFKVELTPVQLATKGVNWGEYELSGPLITVAMDGKQAFEIPVSEISGAVMQPTQKNEVAIEFHQDSTLEEGDESLVDIRFFIPNRSTEENSKTSAQLLHKGLLEVIGGGIQGKDRIATLNKVPILTPRGRYDIELYPTFMKFRGKTHDYKVTYESVSRLFQLPKPDQQHIFFIVTLDPPIRQGAMRYPHLVMHFKKDEKSPPVPIAMPADLKEKEQFKGLPEDEFKDADAYEVVNKLFRAFTQRKITTPGSFKSHNGASAVKCAFKANDGYLYLLERSFFFVHKPPLYPPHATQVSSVEFARVASATNAQASRTFDLLIRLSEGSVHQFTGIQRNEYGSLFNFMQSKKLRIENPDEAVQELAGVIAGADDDEESEEDEDFIGDDDEEEDEEYDSNASDAEGSGEEAEAKPKKDKHEKEGKRKKPTEGEEEPKKKKKKPAAAEEEED